MSGCSVVIKKENWLHKGEGSDEETKEIGKIDKIHAEGRDEAVWLRMDWESWRPWLGTHTIARRIARQTSAIIRVNKVEDWGVISS